MIAFRHDGIGFDLGAGLEPTPLARALSAFETIGLSDLGEAELMDRIDRKFLIPLETLDEILAALSERYRVLEVEGRRMTAYSTCYYDTPDLAMYHAHHAGRNHRYKVRVRQYAGAPVRYLEVKLKANGGRTVKERVALGQDTNPLDQLAETGLLGIAGRFRASSLTPSMLVEYTRVTLARPEAAERITLDFDVTFTRDGRRRAFPDVVIVEVKQGRRARSPVIDALRACKLREGSLSKYCAGMATLERGAKSNRFRPFLRRLEALGLPPVTSTTLNRQGDSL